MAESWLETDFDKENYLDHQRFLKTVEQLRNMGEIVMVSKNQVGHPVNSMGPDAIQERFRQMTIESERKLAEAHVFAEDWRKSELHDLI